MPDRKTVENIEPVKPKPKTQQERRGARTFDHKGGNDPHPEEKNEVIGEQNAPQVTVTDDIEAALEDGADDTEFKNSAGQVITPKPEISKTKKKPRG